MAMDGTVTLANVGSAKEQPVVVADDISRIQFTLENRTGGTHETGFRIAGLPAGEDAVTLGSRTAATIPGGSQEAQRVPSRRRRVDRPGNHYSNLPVI